MKISVYRKAHFNAAHRLHLPQWDEARNKEVFGLCNNPHFHGHNYEITVKVTGDLDEETGMLIDMKALKEFIREEIEEPWDHMNLNLDVAEFKALNPTAENIAIVAWRKLRNRIPKHLSLSIILHETERNFVEYAGE